MSGDLFNRFPKVIMNSNTINMGELIGTPTSYAYSSYSAGATAIENATKSTPETATKQLNARTFVAKVDVYDHIAEDSKMGIIKNLKNLIAQTLSNDISNAIINGDTAVSPSDEDVAASAATDPRRMWDGLRKYAMGVTELNTALTDGGFTLDDLTALNKMGGKYFLGKNTNLAFYILGVAGYNQLLSKVLASSATPLLATASMQNGVVQSYLGHPVVTSEYQREDLEDDGFYDVTGTTLDKGFVTLVNPTQFLIGLRKAITVKVVPDPMNGKKVVIGELRMDFQPLQTPSATIKSVVGGYGFTA
jgi:HK97 family phage major capsid protein